MASKEASLSKAIEAMQHSRPLSAEEICRDYLVTNPGCTDHLRLLGNSLMKQNRLPEAEEQLRFALSLDAEMPQLYEDLGSVLALQSRFDDAIPIFEKAIQLDPRLPLAHKKLGQALVAVGRGSEADEQFEEFFEKSPAAGALAAGMVHYKAGRKEEAIAAFRDVLKKNPQDVNAMRQLAIAYWRAKKNYSDAEALLRRAIQIAPDFIAARMLLGMVLQDANKQLEAIECYEAVTQLKPEDAAAWSALGNAYAQASHPEKAALAFAKSIALEPDVPATQLGYAHVLKTIGDQAGSLRAYRTAIAKQPSFGEAYWSMANLKVFQFEETEVTAMQAQLQKGGLTDSEEVHFRFSLGKAFEDRQDYSRAWHYYDSGNSKQRPLVSHDPLEMELRHAEILKVFNQAFLDANSGNGCDSADPILIVGLPRSGSTLVEQILASHSQVEGTSELPVLGKIAASMGRYRADDMQFPRAVTEFRGQDWRAYGLQYLEAAQRYRQSDKSYFTDKLPNNFPLVGLLHLILPNAKIINARRHPLDSCLGGYKQLFARGQNFTYDIADLSHYYRNYDKVMKHWHEVLPGKVLDVHYEETVIDLESQVRRILDHCGLPFEESCVRFHETRRAVKTASSEQVRQPIYSDALGTWRKYEQHLGQWIDDFKYIINDLPEVVRNAGA